MVRFKRERSKESNTRQNTRKTSPRKVTFQSSYAENTSLPRRRPVARKKSNATSQKRNIAQNTTGSVESAVSYQTQADYRKANRHLFDDARVKLDEEADSEAREDAFMELKARGCNVERGSLVGQGRTSPGSSKIDFVVDDHVLIRILGLDHSEEELDTHLSSLEHRSIEQLEEAYPPRNEWASESSQATAHWKERWGYTALKDGRGKRWIWPPVMQLHRSKMNVVRADESVIFYNSLRPTDPVLFVKRDFVQDEEVLKALSLLSLRSTIERRDVRRNDPGVMINLGYTSGSQGKRMLGIAKNWLSKKAVDNEACKQQDLVDGGWLTLLWNVVLKNLPRVITASYDATIAEMSLPRMPTLRNDGYEVNLGDHRYHFTNGAQAPPSAVTAWNYAKSTHTDINANDYMISLTCHSNADPRSGGNFYLAKYGILVEQASNTCVAWMTKDEHGTTLADPVAGRQNYGVSFDLADSLGIAKRNLDAKEARDAKNDSDLDGADF